jgi:DNA-binding PadR family transcriptional regulator
MAKLSSEKLTTPDLLLLSLLAERAMHGYEANTLLEFHKVRDWAAVSRPQVYYSLDKLARAGLIRAVPEDPDHDEASGGPERNVFETTGKGKSALADALERGDWADQSERPAFLTWMALSWQCRPGVFLKQLRRRRKFVEGELARKREILAAVRKEVGHDFHEAVWMLSFSLNQLSAEQRWLRRVEKEYPRRQTARNPEYEPALEGG